MEAPDFPLAALRWRGQSRPAPMLALIFTEALLIQLVFITALVLFAVAALVRLAKGTPLETEPTAPLPEEPDPGSPPPLPFSPAAEAALEPFDPYAAPMAPPMHAPPEDAPLAGPLKVPTHWYRLKDLGGVAFFVLLYFASQLGSGEKSAKPAEERYTTFVLLFSIAFQVFCGGIAVALMISRVKPVRWLGLRWRQWPLVFAIAPLGVLSVWIFTAALMLSGWSAWLEKVLHAQAVQESVQLLMKSTNPLVLVLMSFSAAIAAPLVEETIFRGYIYPVAKRYCGATAGMIFASMIFAAAHGSSVALLPLFVLAILLCKVYERTGSLWAPISIHFLFNSATIFFQLIGRSFSP